MNKGNLNKYRLISAIIVLGLIFTFTSCIKDIPEQIESNYTWEPAFAFPVGRADFSLNTQGFEPYLLEYDPLMGIQVWELLDEIPLSGEIELDFEEVLGIRDNINFLIMRVNTYNGFPVGTELQAYFENAGRQVIDSLFNPPFQMEAGEIDEAGNSVSIKHNQRDVRFEGDKLDRLFQVKIIRIEGALPKVDLFPDYSFQVQMGAVLGVEYDL